MKVKITTTSYITLYEVGIDEEVKMYCSLCHFGLFLQIQATWILPGFGILTRMAVLLHIPVSEVGGFFLSWLLIIIII